MGERDSKNEQPANRNGDERMEVNEEKTEKKKQQRNGTGTN